MFVGSVWTSPGCNCHIIRKMLLWEATNSCLGFSENMLKMRHSNEAFQVQFFSIIFAWFCSCFKHLCLNSESSTAQCYSLLEFQLHHRMAWVGKNIYRLSRMKMRLTTWEQNESVYCRGKAVCTHLVWES